MQSKQHFDDQALLLQESLAAHGVQAPLEVVKESLAVSFGYQNLPALYDQFPERVPSASLVGGHFWVVSHSSANDEDDFELLAPDCTLEQVASTDEAIARAAIKTACNLDEFMLAKIREQGVAVATYVEGPDYSSNGCPEAANPETVESWLKVWLGVNVVADGVKVSGYDRGDDGAEEVYAEIWVPDELDKLFRQVLFPVRSAIFTR